MMKTVRFTEVVKKSGKPEVYLLLSKDDKPFHNALRQDRIMSLVGGVDGAKTEHGVVGYDAARHGQLLLFPRSLKSFVHARIVGIKFDSFAEPTATELPARSKPAKPARHRPAEVRHEKAAPATPEKSKVIAERKVEKVIPFPKVKPAPPPAELSLDQLKAKARQALRALEKNNAVTAYKLLKEIVS